MSSSPLQCCLQEEVARKDSEGTKDSKESVDSERPMDSERSKEREEMDMSSSDIIRDGK